MRNVILLTFAALLLVAAYNPTDAERARWTMGDMQSWKICFAAYKQDNGAYPEVASAEAARALFEPKYVQKLPMHDAWGNDYGVKANPNGYQVVSAGSDGKFDPSSWKAAGKQSSYDADAVATDEGRWLVRFWEIK